MELSLSRDGLSPSREDQWFRAIATPTPLRHSIFGGSFNIEYWSAELFGPPSDEDPHKKVFEVLHEEGRVGTIEVSSWSGQHLEPFDRLVLLALMGLWYDQGCDPQGRIAFSYRELFRRLDMKAGGRQNEAVKGALARLRGCLVNQRDSFVARTKSGGVVPIEREEDGFHLLQAKRTVTFGTGRNEQTLVICKLGEAVLFGLAGEFLQPRICAAHLRRLKAKTPHAILLHGYFNGRLKAGETRRFLFEDLGRVLRLTARHKSTLIARLLGPLQKLEEAGAIAIAEAPEVRRKQDHVTVTLTVDEPRAEPKLEARPAGPARHEAAFELFGEATLKTDPQIAAAFFTLGVKIERVLERVGVVAEATLWSLLEEMRTRTWDDADAPEAFLLEQLELGYKAPEGYLPPQDRFKKRASP